MRFGDGSDLAYEPSGALTPDTAIGPVRRVLRIGVLPNRPEPSPHEWGDASVKYARPPHEGTGARRGLYVIARDDSIDLVVVSNGTAGTTTEFARSRDDRSDLASVAEHFDEYWPTAVDALGEPPISVDDFVSRIGDNEIGSVKELRAGRYGYTATVEFNGRREEHAAAALIRRDVDPRNPEFWVTQPPADFEETARLLTYIKLRYPLSDFLYSFAATRTQFKPYQYLPALKLLRGASDRLLIADEVGLGKTIEAGLIWAELDMRSPVRRALIVVPAVLQVKWEREMRTRFMRRLRILKPADLRDFVDAIQAGEDPSLLGIVSIESLRTQEGILTDLMRLGSRLDLLVVDEAHALRNRSTRSNRMGQILADLADCVVFLSATPLNLRSEDLFNLVAILDEGAFPNADVFQDQLEPNRILNKVGRLLADPRTRSPTRALEMLEQLNHMEQGAALMQRPDFALLRDVLQRDGDLTAAEVVTVRRLVNDLNTLAEILNRTRKVDVIEDKALRVVEAVRVTFTPQEWGVYRAIERFYIDRARRSAHPTGFLLQMPLRSAASCLPIALQNMTERFAFDADEWRYELDLTDAEMATAIDDVPTLNELDGDSKFDEFLRTIERARLQGLDRALVFTFFRGTVEYLVQRLRSHGIRVMGLHGGVKMAEREAAIQQFRDGAFDVLVANQVGSEGLDFEFCNVLVNYDLPWNPMQVEQRIGRLDRIGQTHEKIFIFNMEVPGTIETDIIARLFDRIGIFEHSIGDLEPIIVETIGEVERVILDPKLSPEQRADEIDRLARVTERKRDDIERIQDSQETLVTPALVDVEGLDTHAPTGGRYIGAHELVRLVDWVVSTSGGRMQPRGDGTYWLTGTADLAHALARLPDPSLGTELDRLELIRRLRESEPFAVAFGKEASERVNNQPELIGAYHPLVRQSIASLGELHARHELRRFGAIRIGDSGRHAVALVSLATLDGLSQTRELWVSAIHPDTLGEISDVESALTLALAEGRVAQPALSPQPISEAHVRRLRAVEDERHHEVEAERSAENRARVDARIVSHERTIRNKIERMRTTLTDQRIRDVDPGILRMNQAQLDNWERELATVAEPLRAKRNLRVRREPMAILHVEF